MDPLQPQQQQQQQQQQQRSTCKYTLHSKDLQLFYCLGFCWVLLHH
jgi:hypothetical protein